MVNNLPAEQEMQVDPWVRKIPGEGNGNPLHCSCLKNPVMEPGGLQSMGLQSVRHN